MDFLAGKDFVLTNATCFSQLLYVLFWGGVDDGSRTAGCLVFDAVVDAIIAL